MEIVAHRGCWYLEEEKNTKEALIRAFEKNLELKLILEIEMVNWL